MVTYFAANSFSFIMAVDYWVEMFCVLIEKILQHPACGMG